MNSLPDVQMLDKNAVEETLNFLENIDLSLLLENIQFEDVLHIHPLDNDEILGEFRATICSTDSKDVQIVATCDAVIDGVSCLTSVETMIDIKKMKTFSQTHREVIRTRHKNAETVELTLEKVVEIMPKTDTEDQLCIIQRDSVPDKIEERCLNLSTEESKRFLSNGASLLFLRILAILEERPEVMEFLMLSDSGRLCPATWVVSEPYVDSWSDTSIDVIQVSRTLHLEAGQEEVWRYILLIYPGSFSRLLRFENSGSPVMMKVAQLPPPVGEEKVTEDSDSSSIEQGQETPETPEPLKLVHFAETSLCSTKFEQLYAGNQETNEASARMSPIESMEEETEEKIRLSLCSRGSIEVEDSLDRAVSSWINEAMEEPSEPAIPEEAPEASNYQSHWFEWDDLNNSLGGLFQMLSPPHDEQITKEEDELSRIQSPPLPHNVTGLVIEEDSTLPSTPHGLVDNESEIVVQTNDGLQEIVDDEQMLPPPYDQQITKEEDELSRIQSPPLPHNVRGLVIEEDTPHGLVDNESTIVQTDDKLEEIVDDQQMLPGMIDDVDGMESRISSASSELEKIFQPVLIKESAVELESPFVRPLIEPKIEDEISLPQIEQPEIALESLTPVDDLKTKFEKVKAQVGIECQTYLEAHPELQTLLSDYLQCLLMAKPADIAQFSAIYFHMQTLSKQNTTTL